MSEESTDPLDAIIEQARACRICEAVLPLGPRPVVRARSSARLLLAGQAPGLRVHQTGVPFDDPSGDQLRRWLGLTREVFYDDSRVAIVSMGFCYPGKGAHGDLPPRPECAQHWHGRILAHLRNVELTVVIGAYAQRYYLGDRMKRTLTETVRAYEEYLPAYWPIPHPSGRNQYWLRANPWFEEEIVTRLRETVRRILEGA